MNILRPGQAGTLKVQVTAPVAPDTPMTAISFDIVDEQGDLVQSPAAGTIIDALAGEVSLAVQAGANTLPPGVTRGIRQCRLTCNYDADVFETTVNYVIRDASPLVIGENSFATYLEAELIGFEQANLTGWAAATEADKINAMITARDDFCRLAYKFDPFYDAQNRITDWPGGMGMHRPDEWTAADLATLPAEFFAALKKAQVFQADYLLGGSPEELARAGGLFSKTVGESSEMYRPGMGPIQHPICKRALLALRGYTTVREWHIGRG